MLSVAFAELWPLDPLDGENEAIERDRSGGTWGRDTLW